MGDDTAAATAAAAADDDGSSSSSIGGDRSDDANDNVCVCVLAPKGIRSPAPVQERTGGDLHCCVRVCVCSLRERFYA